MATLAPWVKSPSLPLSTQQYYDEWKESRQDRLITEKLSFFPNLVSWQFSFSGAGEAAMATSDDRIPAFGLSITQLILECEIVISQIDGLNDSLQQIENLKLSAVQKIKRLQQSKIKDPNEFEERLHKDTDSLYEEISAIRRDRITPVVDAFRKIARDLMSCPDGKKLNRLRGRILSLEYFGVWPSPGTSTARTYLLRGTIPAIDWKEVRNDVETCKVLLKDMADATLKKTKEPLKSSSEFRHSPDYATVVRHGKQFTLTPQQAQIIQILHEAFKNGTHR